jgi:hydrogenase maturation protease
MGKKGRCLVIGVGNRFRSDDAVGLAVTACLRDHELPPHVEVIEAGTDEFGLIEHFKKAEHIVIIDAVSAGRSPGTINFFNAAEINMISGLDNTNLHGFGLADVIILAGKLGISPKVTVVGIEPQSTEYSEKLTCLIASKVPLLLDVVLNLIRSPVSDIQTPWIDAAH